MFGLSPRVQGAILKTGLQMGGRFLKAMHQLWHEITGTFFIILGLTFIPSTIRIWRTPGTRAHAAVATVFIAMMLYFGITAFISAKRVSRGKS